MVSKANVERTHDENERLAMSAIMNAAASRGKGKKGEIPKLEELYKRPTTEELFEKDDKTKAEEVLEKQRNASEWLSQFNITNFGKEDN